MTRRLFRIAAVVAAAAVLAGCQAPGTAMIVNGERVTDRQVSDFVADQRTLFEGAADITLTDGLTSIAFERMATPVAEEMGMAVSDEEALAFINDQRVTMLGLPEVSAADVSQITLDVYGAVILTSQMNTDPQGEELALALQDAIVGADVEVNPRYGLQGSDGVLFEKADLPWIAARG